jgi:aminoglycoside 3-N-acetyltransferase
LLLKIKVSVADMLELAELILKFQQLGLKNGDILLVHSSFKSFGGVKGGPETVIEALTTVLGNEGTLIVPTYNFDFCKNQIFDVRKTPSQMGIISEYVRNNEKSIRTLNPIYSFAIMGKLAKQLGNMEYVNCCGKDSILGKLNELNAKIMIIGVDYTHSLTLFHHIEEMEGCDYRYFKEFHGKIIDYENKCIKNKAIMYVRDLGRGVIGNLEKMGKILEDEEIIEVLKVGSSQIKIMKANEVYIRTSKEMKINPHILCEIKEEN